MWRWKSMLAFLLIICRSVNAQEYDSFTAISEFTGISSAEEIDPSEAERLERFIERPLRINEADLSRINQSGLLTHYQTVSLLDYRSRHGDILSFMELASVDGFTDEFVRKLAPFISLESVRLPGQGRSEFKRILQELEMKGGIKGSDGLKCQYALRYRIEAGERFQASLALSKSPDAIKPDAFSGGLFWNSRSGTTKIALGNFNARFGQGLALWSGMSLSGLSKPSSYVKRTSYLSPSYSYTGNYAFKGVALQTIKNDFMLTFLSAVTSSKEGVGLLPATNLSWLLHDGQVGLTHYVDFGFHSHGANIRDMKTSCDVAFAARGVDFFAEIAYGWASHTAASLAGVVFPVSEDLRMASMLRYYPSSYIPTYSAAARALTKCSNEYGASLSSEFNAGGWVNIKGAEGFGASSRRLQGAVCLDAAYFPVSKSKDEGKSFQLKSLVEMKMMLSSSIALKLRLTERYRTWENPFRTDIRLDWLFYSRYVDAVFRANLVKCAGMGFLSYVEGTVKPERFKISFRTGWFHADRWEDRIYVYERDIPGSFNVPAFYGQGYWLSILASSKISKRGSLSLRGSLTGYPFEEKKKPGKAELKLMLRFRI